MFWTQRCRECFSFDKISHHSDNTQSPHLGNASLLLDNQFPPGVDVTKSVGGVAEVVSIINVFNILKRINIRLDSSAQLASLHLTFILRLPSLVILNLFPVSSSVP